MTRRSVVLTECASFERDHSRREQDPKAKVDLGHRACQIGGRREDIWQANAAEECENTWMVRG